MFGPDEHLSLPFGNQTVEWTITITHLCMILPFNCQSIGDFPFPCLISGGYPHIEMTGMDGLDGYSQLDTAIVHGSNMDVVGTTRVPLLSPK